MGNAAPMRTVVYDRWYRAELARRDRPSRDRHARRRPAIDKREADPRRALVAAVAACDGVGVTLASLSRMIGRQDGYLSRFVAAGVPRALQADEHARLASFFGVDDRGLGVRTLWAPR